VYLSTLFAVKVGGVFVMTLWQSVTLSAVKQGGGGRTGTMTGRGLARHQVGMGVGLSMTKTAETLEGAGKG
jgi:hypothetical protein